MRWVAALALLGGCFIDPDQPPRPIAEGGDGHLAAGYKHACAIRADKSLWCWGDNEHRQVYDSNTKFSGTPTQLPGTWTSVAAGFDHTCGIRDGAIYCWGHATRGQIGVTASGDLAQTLVTLPVTANRVYAGGNASCAIGSDASLWCWGDADKSASAPLLPQQIMPGNLTARWADVSLSDTHACAMTDGGDVYCWGENAIMEVGADASNPIAVADAVHITAATFEAIAVGQFGTCGIATNHSLACWGASVFTNADASPFTTVALPAWQRVALAADQVCAINGNALTCYGGQDSGVNGEFDNLSLSQVMPVATNLVDVAAGEAFACMRDADDNISCLGSNMFGELGNGEVASERAPNDTGLIVQTTNAGAVALGNGFTCALAQDGLASCFGDNRVNQIDHTSAAAIVTPTQLSATAFASLAAGDHHVCGASTDHTMVECHGGPEDVPVPPRPAGMWQRLSASGDATCGIGTSDGTCWGHLPNPATPSVTVTNITQLAANAMEGAFVNGSAVSIWGTDCNYPPTDISMPRMIGMLPDATVELELASDGHACVASGAAAAQISCWGTNFHDQAAPNSSSQCAPVSLIARPISNDWMTVVPDQTHMIAVGGQHTCALTAGHDIACWGDNTDFSIAGPDDLETMPTIIGPPGMLWTQVFTGEHHTCAVAGNTGHLWCWGLDMFGEVGNNKRFHDRPVAVALP